MADCDKENQSGNVKIESEIESGNVKIKSESDSDEDPIVYSRKKKNVRKIVSDDEADDDDIFNTAMLQYNTPNQSQCVGDEEEDKDDKSVEKLILATNAEEEIVVHPKLTKHLKTHQIDGLKFMFDCCFGKVTTTRRIDNSRGCILAHCMGLGKTLQLISLLHTVIRYPQFDTQRILVVCPKSTILNWEAEIKKWLSPIKRGRQMDIFMFPENSTIEQKIHVLGEWFETDPVTKNARCLLVGYESFMKTVFFTKSKRCNRTKEDARRIEKAVAKYLLKPGADLVVLDEGHRVKNQDTATSKAVNRISTKKRIILTGTPMQNNLNEYYSMVNFVKPRFLGSITEFREEYATPIRAGQHKDSAPVFVQGMIEKSYILNKRLSNYVQRRNVTVLKDFLPEKFEYDIFVTMTDIQYELYEYYLLHNPMESGKYLLPDYHAFRKIWSHPKVLEYAYEAAWKADDREQARLDAYYESSSTECSSDADSNDLGYRLDRDGELRYGNEVDGEIRMSSPKHNWWRSIVTQEQLDSLTVSHKMEILFDILRLCDSENEKCLVFSEYTKVLDSVEMIMRQITEKIESNAQYDGLDDYEPDDNVWKRALDYYRIDGSTQQSERFDAIKRFNDPDEKRFRVLLISSKAGGQGVNLIGASRVVMLDTSWNPSNDQQSIFRVFRMGQTRKCYIYRLLAMGTMEEKVYSRSVTKQATSCRVVDKQQIERHYNMAELVELYELTKPNVDERPVPNMPKDKMLAFLLEKHKDIIFKYQEHESLLAEIEETVLTEEQKEALWSEYRLQETMDGQAGFTHRRHGDYDDFSFSDTGDESEHSHSAQSLLSSPHASSSSSSSGSPMPKRFFNKRSFGRRPHFPASKYKKRNPKSGPSAKNPKKF